MYNFHSLAITAAAVAMFSSAVFALDTSLNTNMAVYWVWPSSIRFQLARES